jgi:hypothetical protein
MISTRLFLIGSTLCIGACTANEYPTVRPIHSQAITHETLFERAYGEGKRQLADGRAGLAIVAFERAVRLDPLSVDALNGIGAAYDDLNRYDIALGYYKRALLLAPKSADTTNNIAVSLQLAGDLTAHDWFERAAHLDPSNPIIASNIVQARAEKADSRTSHATIAEEAPYNAPETIADTNLPTLQRSGEAEFQLGLPGKSVTPDVATKPITHSMLMPIVARIDSPAANLSDGSALRASSATPPQSPLGEPAPAKAILPSAEAADTTVASGLTVSNCAGRTHMAQRFREFFQRNDISVRHIVNAPVYDCEKSKLLAHTGREAEVQALARFLPLEIAIETDDTTPDDIHLVLGRDLIAFDSTLGE